MTLNFNLENKKFEDYLDVTVNGNKKELNVKESRISFELQGEAQVQVSVEYRRVEPREVKNPIARFFVWLFFILISPLVFFADNTSGIRVHKFFCEAKPFDLKKTFIITPTEDTVSLRFVAPKYQKCKKRFLPPDIEIGAEDITDAQTYTSYNRAHTRRAFRIYHYPAYALLFALASAILALNVAILIKQFSPFDLWGVIAVSLCAAFILMLLFAIVKLFISTHRLMKDIEEIYTTDKNDNGGAL